jgi:hypothetical protein
MTRYNKDNLPSAERAARWDEYRKIGTTRMWGPVAGPFTLETREGEYESLPAGWKGFIALDTDGYPYPVEADEHARSYERVA